MVVSVQVAGHCAVDMDAPETIHYSNHIIIREVHEGRQRGREVALHCVSDKWVISKSREKESEGVIQMERCRGEGGTA